MLFHRAPSGADLQEHGVEVEGRVIKMESPKSGDRISYSFKAGERRMSVEYRTVADFDGLTRLGPITVWYDPADPNRCLTPNEIRAQSGGKTLMGVIILALMMGLSGYQVYLILWRGATGE
jgi:hypothetical protein